MSKFHFIYLALAYTAVLSVANATAFDRGEWSDGYCNATRCSNFRNFTYNDVDDLLTCKCLPGWEGFCCESESKCANGQWDRVKSVCHCDDPHYEGERCEVVSCANDGQYVAEERWASPTATGCTCYPGNYGDFCEFGERVMSAGKTVRVRITTVTRTNSYSSWNRPPSSPHYHVVNSYSTYGTSRGVNETSNLVWLWVLIVFIVLFLVFVCIASNSDSSSTSTTTHTYTTNDSVVYTGNNYGNGETVETTTVVEVEMTEDEANNLLNNPELAANYTDDYHDAYGGDTTTTIEILRD